MVCESLAPKRQDGRTGEPRLACARPTGGGRRLIGVPRVWFALRAGRKAGKNRVIRSESRVAGRFSGVWASFCCFLAKVGDKINGR
jgi:hypothetical protein